MHNKKNMFSEGKKNGIIVFCKLILQLIIICYVHKALFWVLKALYMDGGNLFNNHQCAASTWMMRRQPYCTRMPTTHQLIGGEETEWWSQSVDMWIIRRPWWSESNGWIWPGCRSYSLLCFEGHPGIFNDHRESESRVNISSKGRCLLTVKCPHHGETCRDFFWKFSSPTFPS